MKSHVVSIIVPVYNGGSTLRQCLESIFKSVYKNFECIVVDDHSNDNSLEIAGLFKTEIVRLDKQRGAAYARNRGAEAARGDILLFIDSDVTMYPDCLERVIKEFDNNPEIAALFGSYDDKPESSNFFSQYKNLFHYYTHQISREDASTFWCGCGAVRRDVFNKAGGFDQNRYSNASIEDIELGSRIKTMGHRILLCKTLQVKHLKRWTFTSLLRADIFYRAIPWSELILERQEMIADLNLKISDRISAGLVCLSVGVIPCSFFKPQLLFLIPILLSIVMMLNYKLYRFFHKRKGLKFASLVVVMHLLYYLYSSIAFTWCWCKHLFAGKKVLSESRSG